MALAGIGLQLRRRRLGRDVDRLGDRGHFQLDGHVDGDGRADVDGAMLRGEALHVDVQLVRVVGDVVEGEGAVGAGRAVGVESGDVVAQRDHHAGERPVIGPKDFAADHARGGSEERGRGEKQKKSGERMSLHARSRARAYARPDAFPTNGRNHRMSGLLDQTLARRSSGRRP